jgi:hypothetical protein
MAIVTLRYLYFGLPEPETLSHLSRSPTPTPMGSETTRSGAYDVSEDWLHGANKNATGYNLGESTEGYFDPEYLSPEGDMNDPSSRAPSPLLSPRPDNESIVFDHWHRRYEIHNEAVSELSCSFSALSILQDASYLRYAFLPLVILALVSQPGSHERALSIAQFHRFNNSIAHKRATSNPIGGSPLDFDIPWDRLDAYSAEIEQQRRDNVVFVEPQLYNAAPEWNWWYMLKQTKLTPICEYLHPSA